MSRKDNKGRNLKAGESQRADGRYMYRYKDEITGKRITIYDASLAGLREKERAIDKDMEDLLITDPALKKLTLNALFESYISIKQIKESTKRNYVNMWNQRVKDQIGNYKILQLKSSHILKLYAKLSEEGLAHNTIKYLHSMIYPTLELAVQDGILRKNPAKVCIKEYGIKAKEKEALTPTQQERLLKFAESSKTYNCRVPLLQIMFGTCLRTGELIGLTWDDVDMKKKEIHISNQLIYKDLGEGYRFHDSTPKTEAGIRVIPMTQTVYKAFARQRELNFLTGNISDVEIGGKEDFIFNTKTGRPIMPSGLNSMLRNLVNAYNKRESYIAENEIRDPEYIPHISAHTLRHTGCTRLGEQRIDPKVMQYVMGHSEIGVTMDIYNHITGIDRVAKELERVNDEISCGKVV